MDIWRLRQPRRNSDIYHEAREALAEIAKISPGYLARMEQDLNSRNVHPDLVVALRNALQKIGSDTLQGNARVRR